jgi:DNA-binding PadR family transcriptional regulator
VKQVPKAVPDVAEATDEASRGGSAAASPVADSAGHGGSPAVDSADQEQGSSPAAAADSADREQGSSPAADSAGRGATPAADDQEQGSSPVHRGWMPLAGRRRWIEPFVLAMLARGSTYGYAILGRLEEMHITNGPVDVGLIYRTLRDLEDAKQVRSSWSDESSGPRRRAYELTEAGYQALDDCAAVMRERARLIGEFNADYLEAVSAPRPTPR